MSVKRELTVYTAIKLLLFCRTYFSDKIFELGDQIDFFRMLHYVILVVLLNRLVLK